MLTQFFVKHPVSTWMIFGAFVVLAIYALPRMEVEAIPEVDLPSLTVQTGWAGASPQSIQRSISIPVEEAVRGVHGVESVKSTSRAGSSTVEVEFGRDIDLDFARLDLNEQLGSVRRNLPDNATPPVISSFVPEEFATEQFFTFSIISPLDPNELREKCETWIQPQILAIEGVADAQVNGGADPLVKILLDREKLERHEIGAGEIFAAIQLLDDVRGVGAIREGGLEKLVALRDPLAREELPGAIVARRGGRNFRLNELGSVENGADDPTYFARIDGNNVVSIQVEKRSGSNSVTVSRALHQALPEMESELPFQASFRVDQDEGKDLNDKLWELVIRSLVILLVLFILLAFSLRQVYLTAIVIGSIIFSLVICLSFYYFLDLSVNFITISGLTICFGLQLDNSILVLDAIGRKLRGLQRAEDAGLSRRSKLRVAQHTIIAGTNEVVFPILATTVTTLVAFLSFIFLSGRLAVYYVPLAISVATTTIASVFVAFGWIPVVLNQTWAARLVRRTQDGPREVEDAIEIEKIVEHLPDLDAKPTRSERFMGWTQRLWPLVTVVIVGLFVLTGWAYQKKISKGGFWQMPDDEKITFFMRMPEGTDIRVVSQTMEKFEALILPLDEGATMKTQVFGNSAFMEVEYEDELKRGAIPYFHRNSLVELADNTGGSRIFIGGFSDQPYFRGGMMGNSSNSLVKLTGYNSKRLNELAEGVLEIVQGNRRVREPRITTDTRFGASQLEETVVTLRRDALAEKSLAVSDVVIHLQRLLGVDRTQSMVISGEQERVKLSYSDSEDIQYSDVAAQVITGPSGEKVRLLDLVDLSVQPMSSWIEREDQRYTVLVNWEYVGTDRMRRSYIQGVLDTIELPYGYTAEEGRQEFLTEEEEQNLQLTLILSLIFIFIVMAAMFESTSLPFLVLTSVPMSLVGVVFIFWWSSATFDSSARIGLVLLFGVVVNNAILLVERFRHEAERTLKARFGGDPAAEAALFQGMRKHLGGSDLWMLPKEERVYQLWRAISRATLIKTRSILLITATTVVSLIPLLIKVQSLPWSPKWLFGLTLPWTLKWMDAENQDIWENLALSTVGGMVSSTLLMLLAMPAFYYFSVRCNWWIRRFNAWAGGVLRRQRLRRAIGVEPAGESLGQR